MPHSPTFKSSLTSALVASLLIAATLPGCSRPFTVDWPEHPIQTQAATAETGERVWAVGSVENGNYTQRFTDGRVTEIAFDDDADGTTDEVVPLTSPASDAIPHFIIILDGVPFDLLEEMYRDGYFRLFPPPSRLVSVFPVMTDVALSRLFHTQACVASEAQFYDRETGAMSDANDVYLSGANAPWLRSVDYHAPQSVAVRTYLQPKAVFSAELQAMYELFSTTKKRRAIAYSVGTAGLGTRGGASAIRDYLEQVDRLCERITYERRGQVRFSIFADHGHGLQKCHRVSFSHHLQQSGFHMNDRLESPKDVVVVSYGLVTCAQFYTERPRELAEALLYHEAVDLVAYADGANVVVRSEQGTAAIQRVPEGFRYRTVSGDPLLFQNVLDTISPAGNDGNETPLLDDRSVLEATVQHKYPDPLYRLWNAFQGYVKKPADVIVSLKPEFCHGSKFFYTFVAPIESTHGSLDYESSVTFILTNATEAPLPQTLRMEDVSDALLHRTPSSSKGRSQQKPASQY